MTIKIFSRELLHKSKPTAKFAPGLQIKEHLRETAQLPGGHHVYEFVGIGDFGSAWQTRQRFEVDAGRDEEPILYTPIYDIVSDPSLPKNVTINKIGPGGVIFEEVFEGGEVKFSSIASSQETTPIRHWATGLEYSKDLVIFNELWDVPLMERQMGVAHNALLNHLHLGPILTYSYGSDNQTAATNVADSLVEETLFTIEAGITAAKADATNPRRGPYTLLISSSNFFTIEKALQVVPQQGVSMQSSAKSMINSIIVYDGWSGTRGNKTVTYSGVTANKAYLISQQYRGQDMRSWVKQELMNEGMQEDISRFLTERFGTPT